MKNVDFSIKKAFKNVIEYWVLLTRRKHKIFEKYFGMNIYGDNGPISISSFSLKKSTFKWKNSFSLCCDLEMGTFVPKNVYL